MVERTPTYVVREPKRAAVRSLRGYRYQLLHTVKRCLDLDQTTLLVIEGNEDIDQIGLGPDPAAVEEQIKLRCDGLEWRSVTDVLMHFAVAFEHYHRANRSFLGILRTNVAIAKGPDSAIRRWIEGRRPNQRKILRELRQLAQASETAIHKNAVAYVARNAGIGRFIEAVEWAVSAPGPDEIEAQLLAQMSTRVPDVSPDTAVRVLIAEVLRRSTSTAVPDRTLSRIAIDLVLNDLVLQQLVDDFSCEASASKFSLVSRQNENAAVAVIVLTSRATSLASSIRRRVEGHEVLGGQTDRRAAVLEELQRADVVVCASVIAGGRRRRAVCIRDAARQAGYRWQMPLVEVPTDFAVATEAALSRVLPQTRFRLADQSDLVLIADVIAAALLQWISTHQLEPALRALGPKLRWVHRIDTREYFTAASPIPELVVPTPS